MPSWLETDSLREKAWSDPLARKYIVAQLRMETVLEAMLKGWNKVKVNRRKDQYGENPLPSLL